MLSSDPSAWLRSYFERLTADPTFRLLAPLHQFEQLVGAAGIDHLREAAKMMEWSPTAQVAAVGASRHDGRTASEHDIGGVVAGAKGRT